MKTEAKIMTGIALIGLMALMGSLGILGYMYGMSEGQLEAMNDWRDRVYEQVAAPEYAPVDTSDNGYGG